MDNDIPITCGCLQCTVPARPEDRADEFYRIRAQCPALQVLIPEAELERHIAFTSKPQDDAFHCSIPIMAYCLGHLPDLCGLIHRYVLKKCIPGAEINPQYLKDLRETWIFKPDETSRYRAARLLFSRIAELSLANWLELAQWKIIDMELYGGDFDISARDPSGTTVDFEVKFLAQREAIFELNVASFRNPVAQSIARYSPLDYLTFRVYEAARQIRHSAKKRIVAAVVTDYALSYQIPLSDGWLNWSQPKFLRLDSEIDEFLAKQYQLNPTLDADVSDAINSLDEIWVMRYKEHFKLARPHHYSVARK